MTTATKTRRGLSLLLALVLLAGMLPTAALAAEEPAEPPVTEEPTPTPETEGGDTEETEPAAPPETEGTGEPETPAEPGETEPGETTEPTETPESSENPEPGETTEPTETPEPSESPEPEETTEPSIEPTEAPATEGTWENGEDGEGQWTYDPEQKLLTVTGEGKLPDYTEENPAPWTQFRERIQKIELKEKITAVGKRAFAGCKELAEIELPKELASVGENAFYGCDKLLTVTFAGTKAEWESVVIAESGNGNLSSADVAYILEPTATPGIPQGNGGMEGPEFEGQMTPAPSSDVGESPEPSESPEPGENDSILPMAAETDSSGTIEGFGSWSFDSGSGVLTITGSGSMPDFSEGTAPWYTYKDKIKSFVLSDGITGIGAYAFYQCGIEGEITLGTTITSVGKFAFSGTKITEVTVPGSISTLNIQTFSNCSNLGNAVIEEGVTEILGTVFLKCGNLTEIHLPRSLTSIGQGAFNNCTNLATVYYNGTETEWNEITINTKGPAPKNKNLLDAKKIFLADEAITGITLDKNELELTVGQSEVLTATLEPEGIEGEIYWSSSDPTIAAVEDGKVTGVGPGTAVITAKAGKSTADCTVTVKGVALNVYDLILTVGESATLKVRTEDEKTPVVWTSSQDAVAEVSQDGEVTARTTGETVVTATAGEYSAECKVKVVAEGEVPAPDEFIFSATSRNDYAADGIVHPKAVRRDAWTYDLSLPATAVTDKGSALVIQAPEGFSGEFSVSYMAYANNSVDSHPQKTTVTSAEGKIEIGDYFTTSENVIYSNNITLTVNGREFSLVLEPYGEMDNFIIKNQSGFYYSNSVIVVDDAHYKLAVMQGETIDIWLTFAGNLGDGEIISYGIKYKVLIDGEPQGSGLKYTHQGQEKTFEFKIVPEEGNTYSDRISTGAVYLTIVTEENSNLPLIQDYGIFNKSYQVEGGKAGEPFTFELTVSNVGDETTYSWWDPTAIELTPYDASTNKIEIHTEFPQRVALRCSITNTVDGKEYTATTGIINVYIQPSGDSIDPPVLCLQPPQETIYMTGEDITPVKADVTRLGGYTYTQQWYSNTSDSMEGAVPVDKSPRPVSGDNIGITPDISELGSTWYYVKVSAEYQCWTKSGTVTYTSEPVTSDLAKVTVEKLDFALSGSGTESDPYLIKTYDDLLAVQDKVNGGISFQGTHFKMTADIALEDDWVPIGCTKDGSNKVASGNNLNAFRGIFDGGGHLITVAHNGRPLFGYVWGATIRNLNIYGTRINGFGLIECWHGVGIRSTGVTISGVTIKSGTNIVKSGLLGGEMNGENGFAAATAEFVAYISDCHVESGVTIGCDGNQTYVGSIAGRINGSITNCSSAATVKGQNYVGGILGIKDNGLGTCKITGCSFSGSVSGVNDVGGIVGGVYFNSTAPNGTRVHIQDCTVSGTVSGTNSVGGILGGDEYTAQPWSVTNITGNRFTGTVSGSSNVGGIIGFYCGINRTDNIAGNYYAPGHGASSGLGGCRFVDTSCETHETARKGVTYLNSAVDSLGYGSFGVTGCWWTANYNRDDDPLGADISKLFTSEDVLMPTSMAITGEYKTEYTCGEDLDLSGAVITVTYSDKTTRTVDWKTLKITGYDTNTPGDQSVTLIFTDEATGITVRTAITVHVTPKSSKITVTVSILGDSKHGESGAVHTLSGGGLQTWVAARQYDADTAWTVWDLLQKVFEENGITARTSNKLGTVYIEALTRGGVTLAEFDNGPNSGWMYTVNGHHSQNGVSQQYLHDKDNIVLHYSDDYTLEEGNPESADDAVKKVEDLIDAIGDNVTLDSKDKIEAARKAYNALTYAQKQQVSNYGKLQAAEAKLRELQAEADKTAAKAVEDQIDALPSPAGEADREAVAAARKAYDALTDAQKKLVKNYQKLVEAQRDIALLDATPEDIEAADAVQKLIDALPEPVKTEDKAAVEAARKAYDALTDLQKLLVTNLTKLEAAEERLSLLDALKPSLDIYAAAGEFIESLRDLTEEADLYALGMARSGHEVSGKFYEAVEEYVAEYIDESGRLHRSRSEDNSRTILVLTALGRDVTDVGGHNLLLGLSDMEYLKKQGVTGPAWALIALDSHDYEIPENPEAEEQASREKIVEYLMEEANEDGGWSISGKLSEAETTAVVLTALAGYYPEDEETGEDLDEAAEKLKAVVDKGVQTLSDMQDEDGGYSALAKDGTTMEPNSGSAAAVLTALSALNIDGHTDERFVKNGKSVIDALCEYSVEGGGFSEKKEGERSEGATEVAYTALTAYLRMLEGETALYDMSDVEIEAPAEAKPLTALTEPEPTEAPEAAPEVPETTQPPEAPEEEKPSLWDRIVGWFR